MYRFIVALAIIIASTAASSAQVSIWRSDRGAILKVLNRDAATRTFSGVFISSPTGPCPAVPYDLAGRVLPKRKVVFTTSRTWTSDCAATVVWYGPALDQTVATVKWRSRTVAPNGQVIRRRGTEIFRRV